MMNTKIPSASVLKGQWTTGPILSGWISAQAGFGDLWRKDLVNPLVKHMCQELSSGGSTFDFSSFLPLQASKLNHTRSSDAKMIDGVCVFDLGCGEGCLGRWVTSFGIEYIGVDGSSTLIEHAKSNGLNDVSEFDLDALQSEDIKQRLAGKDLSKVLITCIVVLEYLELVDKFLNALGHYLATVDHDVPVLIVTLNPGLFDLTDDGLQTNTLDQHYEISVPIDSITSEQNQVVARLRSHIEYDRLFRNSGFFVHSCEPLHFSGLHLDQTFQSIDSATPQFWAWRLSARRKIKTQTTELLKCFKELGGVNVAGLNQCLSAIDGAFDRLRFIEIEPKTPIIRAGTLGGELTVLLMGRATIRSNQGDIVVGPGEILGELEIGAVGAACYHYHSLIAGPDGCTVAIVSSSDVSKILDAQNGFGYNLYQNLRNRLQLAVLYHGVHEVGFGAWPEVPGLLGKEKTVKFVAPQYIWRAARALLWAATIERRVRGRGVMDDMCVFNIPRVGRRFQPDDADANGLRDALRLFHKLGIIDAFPCGCILDDDTGMTTDMLKASWQSFIKSATETLLFDYFSCRDKTDVVGKIYSNLILDSNAVEKDGRVTRSFASLINENLSPMLPSSPEATKARSRWEQLLVRVHTLLKDKTGTDLFFVLRDMPTLRKIVLGTRADIAQIIIPRFNYFFGQPKLVKFTWPLMTGAATDRRKRNYIRLLTRLLLRDINYTQSFSHSDEMEAWR